MMKQYRIVDGPFKGSRFLSDATIAQMNTHPDFKVVFTDGPLKGLKTRSVILYDRKIECLDEKWQKLLSNARNI